MKDDFNQWKKAPNILIDDFDVNILDKMMENVESYELHDEIIAMTCHKHKTKLIHTKDIQFKDYWKLNPMIW